MTIKHSDVEYEDDQFDTAADETKLHEFRLENILLVVKPGSIVALFSTLKCFGVVLLVQSDRI